MATVNAKENCVALPSSHSEETNLKSENDKDLFGNPSAISLGYMVCEGWDGADRDPEPMPALSTPATEPRWHESNELPTGSLKGDGFSNLGNDPEIS